MSLKSPDLTQCADEPIRTPGAIQPHGWLIIVSAATRRLLAYSQNCPGMDAIEAVLATLQDDLARLVPGEVSAVLGAVDIGTRAYGALAHRTGDTVVVEFEPYSPDNGLRAPIYSLARHFLPELQKAESMLQVAALAAAELKRLSGFGRCLIYCFDSSGHGHVLAEEKDLGYASFLGLRFPASDIPAQARELYVRNHFRLIPDARYRAVPLQCVDPACKPETIDLSQAGLRSVSPVHLEYLRNMNTLASLSVSIVVGGQLWGLISCHNRQPQLLAFQTRVACEHLGRLVSMQIAVMQEQAEMAERRELRNLALELVSQLARSDGTLRQLTHEPLALLRLASASGAAVVHNDDCWTIGITPEREQIHALVSWVSALGKPVFHTHQLAAAFAPANAYPKVAAGLLAISISNVHRHQILWFRSEITQAIEWAGKPYQELRGVNGRINPHRSFAAWQEEVSGQSAGWSQAEKAMAELLRHALVEIVLVSAEEMAKVSAELGRVNQQIRSFSYSVSHELRQPLISVSGFSQRLHQRLQAAGDAQGVHYLGRILAATRQAEAISEALLELARISGASLNFEEIDLSAQAALMVHMLRQQEPARQVKVLIELGMTASGDARLLQVALNHLIGNAWKFTSTQIDGEFCVGSGTAPDGERMWWIQDNGVGFDMAHSGQLFKPFHRLHASDEFQGLGAGLAVVHAAITRHGGSVWAHAKPGGGAKLCFTLGQAKPTAPAAAR